LDKKITASTLNPGLLFDPDFSRLIQKSSHNVDSDINHLKIENKKVLKSKV